MFSCTDSCDEGTRNAGEPWVRRTVENEQDAMPETGIAFEDHVRREANAAPQLLPPTSEAAIVISPHYFSKCFAP
ncbi:hypothetical protein Mp_Vg00910 [Marchantia polymorpha subsp. ruderalis]|uniref:Uncharacterized protein n=1 Tax=Marchantia polymorpha TaxID=3197 RepID=A0A2R6VXQ8_MARPO|nr:hypothetical protein MARPO_2046s0001 [Marchantia polymorpha]BBN20604.1 hypothetical protein Mp_Vg00910 [Marchantia polymorpha subsp. ruderalis]|eukprot:PTQ26394.1 hypothetical protein MARPO_2046s0001 [Marchantia polymorpha]